MRTAPPCWKNNGRVHSFPYISVFGEAEFTRSGLVAAKERFFLEPAAAPLSSLLVRTTGFFSEMKDLLDMAKRGRV